MEHGRGAGYDRDFFPGNDLQDLAGIELLDENARSAQGDTQGEMVVQGRGVVERPDDEGYFSFFLFPSQDGIEKVP